GCPEPADRRPQPGPRPLCPLPGRRGGTGDRADAGAGRQDHRRARGPRHHRGGDLLPDDPGRGRG
ncbi:MAG: Repair of Iron Centers di-iron protein, partial [uncultured Acidimicrobiales bacterium]